MEKDTPSYVSLTQKEWHMPDNAKITREDVVAGYIIHMSGTLENVAVDPKSIKVQIRDFRTLKRQNSALRGVITKLKKRVKR